MSNAFLKESSEAASRQAYGRGNEVDPDKAAIIAMWPLGDELKDQGELINQRLRRRLAGAEARNQAAEINASGNSESRSDVLAELLR